MGRQGSLPRGKFPCNRHHPVNPKRALLRYGKGNFFAFLFAAPGYYTKAFAKKQAVLRTFAGAEAIFLRSARSRGLRWRLFGELRQNLPLAPPGAFFDGGAAHQDGVLADDLDVLPGDDGVLLPPQQPEQPVPPADDDGGEGSAFGVQLHIPDIAEPHPVPGVDDVLVFKIVDAAQHTLPLPDSDWYTVFPGGGKNACSGKANRSGRRSSAARAWSR